MAAESTRCGMAVDADSCMDIIDLSAAAAGGKSSCDEEEEDAVGGGCQAASAMSLRGSREREELG